jgi:ATP-dependent 26S proteasome regulatory subunit
MCILQKYAAAAYPAVAVETVEEERLQAHLLAEFPDRAIFSIAAVGGLKDVRRGAVVDPAAQFTKAFVAVAQKENAILIVYDFQHIVHNAPAYRSLKDVLPALKARGSMIILVAPAWRLPAELEHDIPVIQFPLPTREELRAALEVVTSAIGATVDNPQPLLEAAAGLTLQEAENSFALAVVEGRGQIDDRIVEREKMRLVRQSGYLEVSAPVPLETVGGLQGLKDYILSEVLPAKDDPELFVRGILLVGVPGTGKSLSAKAVGAVLRWPVLRLDIGALKGSLVGQSEQNMRAALKLADAVAPCVLWLDEIEKGVGGYASSAHTDSGVTLGMVGALLTWMQEHTTPVTVVATCNDYTKLPPELTRAGRFDERFFVDLPSASEREEIARVHLARFGGDPALAEFIAGITEDWTGAEIEQLVKSAARRTRRQITVEAIETCAREIKPIAHVRADEITKLREWAKQSLRLANTPSVPQAQTQIRKMGVKEHV